MGLPNGPWTPIKVIAENAGGYADITSSVDVSYVNTDGAWAVVVTSTVPISGHILT